MEVGRKYKAEIMITDKKAEFYLDGEKYYSCKLEKGAIESEGRIGFTSFSGDGRSKVSDFIDMNVSPYPEPKYNAIASDQSYEKAYNVSNLAY